MLCGFGVESLTMLLFAIAQRFSIKSMLESDGVIGQPSLWIAEDFWVLRFRLMVKRGP